MTLSPNTIPLKPIRLRKLYNFLTLWPNTIPLNPIKILYIWANLTYNSMVSILAISLSRHYWGYTWMIFRNGCDYTWKILGNWFYFIFTISSNDCLHLSWYGLKNTNQINIQNLVYYSNGLPRPGPKFVQYSKIKRDHKIFLKKKLVCMIVQ